MNSEHAYRVSKHRPLCAVSAGMPVQQKVPITHHAGKPRAARLHRPKARKP